MTYCNSQEVWDNLGQNAYNRVRSEIVGTGAGTSWDLDHNNVILDSLKFYTGSSQITSSYSIDLDEGKITYTGSTGIVLTADYDYSTLKDSTIQQLISSSDTMINSNLGRTFGTTTGSVEYLDVNSKQKTFFTKNYPIITLSSVETNIAVSEADVPNWETKTLGLGNDYLADADDLLMGKIRFIDNFPYVGQDRIKLTYNYGYSTVPDPIKRLSILYTIRSLINNTVYKSIIVGQDNFTPIRLEEVNLAIEEIEKNYRKQSISSI